MSGPKYGTAVLEASRRAAIRARIQNEIEQMRRESEALKRRLEEEKLSSLKSQIHALTTRNSNLRTEFLSSGIREKVQESKKLVSSSEEIAVLEQLLEDITNLSFLEPSYSDSIEAEASLNALKQNENTLKEHIGDTKRILSSLGVKYSKELANRKESDFLSKVFKKEEVTIGKEITESKEYQDFVGLAEKLGNHQKDVDCIDKLISNSAIDTPYKFKQIALRMEALTLELAQISLDDAMSEEISYLQKQLGIQESIPFSKEDCASYLEKLKSQLEDKYADEYINQSIAAVMEECGYDIVRNDLMKNGERRVEKSYFDYSDDSILQVASSDSGAIMFEVMSRKKNNDITSSDKVAVKSDMETFCPDYHMIRDKLAQKGVLLKNEKLMPPDEKYVRSVGIDVPVHSSNISRRAGTKHKVRHFDD